MKSQAGEPKKPKGKRRRAQQWAQDRMDLPPMPPNLTLAHVRDELANCSDRLQAWVQLSLDAGAGNSEATMNLMQSSGQITDEWRKTVDLLDEMPVSEARITCSHCPETRESDQFMKIYHRYLPNAWKALKQIELALSTPGIKPATRSVRQWALAASTAVGKARFAHENLGRLNISVSVLSRHRHELAGIMEKLALALQNNEGAGA